MVIGDKGWLSGNAAPCVIPRPYQWERGDTLPKRYVHTAKRLVKKKAEKTGGCLRSFLIAIVVGGILGLIPSVLFALLDGSITAWIYSFVLIAIDLLAFLFVFFLERGVKDSADARETTLSRGDFQWRTGQLDDVVAEFVGYRRSGDGSECPEYSLSVYADGEMFSSFWLLDTEVDAVKKLSPGGKPVLGVKASGKMHAGDAVVLIDIGSIVLILPR